MSIPGHPYADLLESPALSPTHKRTLSVEERNAIYWAGISNPSTPPPPTTCNALLGSPQKPEVDFEAYPGAGISPTGIQHKQASSPASRSVVYRPDPKVAYANSYSIPQSPAHAEVSKEIPKELSQGKLTEQDDGGGCCIIL